MKNFWKRFVTWLMARPKDKAPTCDRCGKPLSLVDVNQRRTRHLGCVTTFDP